MKEIKESAFGTGCAQERSGNFCDFINFLRPFGSKRQSRALRDIETSAQPSRQGRIRSVQICEIRDIREYL